MIKNRPGAVSNQQAFQNSFSSYMQNRPANSIFAGFPTSSPKGAGARRAAEKAAAKANPAAPAAPAAPSQWSFQANPLDQAPSSVGQAPGNSPWAYSPPVQPWMFNPTGQWGGGWQDPGFNIPPEIMSQLQTLLQQRAQQPTLGGPLPPYDPSGQQPQLGGPLPPYQPSSGGYWNGPSYSTGSTYPSTSYNGLPAQPLKTY